MFTWICPTCGREVPPSYDACPDCAAKAKSDALTTPEGAPSDIVAPVVPPGVPPVHQAPAHLHPAAPSPHTAVPTWLLAILFAFAFIGLGGGVYWLVHYFTGNRASATSPAETIPAKTTGKEHAMQKYIEVSGIRFVETPKKETEARFLVVNHSGADITDLGGTVNIWGRTNRSEEEAAGTFSFKLPSLGPNESKEASAPLKTKLKVYELPDWQNISAEVQITSP
jgi:hypothetical protein